jgi:site-specific DNA recombinase
MKAVIYARYSSDNQREESIDAQVRAIKEYAERNSIQIVRIYVDEARSATTDSRPEFLRMIKDASTKSFDAVIVHKLDRFSRDRYDSIISVLENLDGSPESIILESLLVGMAEYYSQNLAREVRKGMKETALQCKHNGGIPPLGYDIAEDKTYIVNENEAIVVRHIFELYAAGYGYKHIVSKLREKGYKTKLGRDFNITGIYDILRNEKYIGIYVFNRTASKVDGKRNNHASKPEEEIIKIPGGIPAIIDEELFQSIKERMSQRKTNARNKAKEVYLLSGIIFCAQCDSAMIGHTSQSGRNKTKYSTYKCGERYRSKSCDLKAVNRDFVEEMTIRELKEKIFNTAALNRLADKLIAQYQKLQQEDIGDLKILEQKYNEIQNKIDNIINAIADGMYNPSMKVSMGRLEQEKDEISSTISEMKNRMLCTTLDRDMIINYLKKDMEAIESKNPDDLKKIIQTYVEKVIVSQDHVDIHLIVHSNGGGEGTPDPLSPMVLTIS